jgi:hypothetical protein
MLTMLDLIHFIRDFGRKTLRAILANLYADLAIFSQDAYMTLRTELLINAIEAILASPVVSSDEIQGEIIIK